MHERFLGDSYDIVKRYWGELLSPIAPLLAHPRFIPLDLRQAFTRLTNIPVGSDERGDTRPYALLLDPHTGIPMPDAVKQRVGVSHAPIDWIARLFDDNYLSFIICFDQATARRHELDARDQREKKRIALGDLGVASFYYLSHAPFLFASKSPNILHEVRTRILSAGIPENTSAGPRVQPIRALP